MRYLIGSLLVLGLCLTSCRQEETSGAVTLQHWGPLVKFDGKWPDYWPAGLEILPFSDAKTRGFMCAPSDRGPTYAVDQFFVETPEQVIPLVRDLHKSRYSKVTEGPEGEGIFWIDGPTLDGKQDSFTTKLVTVGPLPDSVANKPDFDKSLKTMVKILINDKK
jgi:hypothetical protein